ncbi:hypothetical protein [Streptomyces atratus]|uniref:hypothetical protein n=1 Tax=Streptomyces atratus TaxID=1893 RepID=UPI0016711048|nr:hypothetical protein [Streptomyces atratus]WPW27531.1 hypothetical protein P6B95_09145 [Streptomyces atratus]GGT54760.1 hypothetical protein GCM10010207_63390 [Streptomyces atratus]
MNGRFRFIALAPLAVSSLALGSVSFATGSAQAVAPAATCHVTQDPGGNAFNVIAQGLTPGSPVQLRVGGKITPVALEAGADGGLQTSLSVITGFGAMTLQEEGGPRLTCGTVKQAEEKEVNDQLAMGFKAGFAAAKEACTAELPAGIAAPDPNFEKGFNMGKDAAIARFC